MSGARKTKTVIGGMTVPPDLQKRMEADLPRLQAAARVADEVKTRTPEPVRVAFMDAPFTLGSVTLLRFTQGHFFVLETIKHPWVSAPTAEDAKKAIDDLALENFQLMEGLFAMAHSPHTSRELLAQGRAAYTEAVHLFCDDLPIEHVPTLAKAAAGIIAKGVSTMIEAATKQEAGGSGTPFEAKAPGKTPGSAGG